MSQIIQTHNAEGQGNVIGPGESTEDAIARWDGTTGTLLKDSGIIIDDNDNITGINQIIISDDAFIGGELQVLGTSNLLETNVIGDVEVTGDIRLDGTMIFLEGIRLHNKIISTSPYKVLLSDFYLSVDTSVIPITIRLDITPFDGETIIIKDNANNASVNNITIVCQNPAIKIDGLSSYVINVNKGSVQLNFVDGSPLGWEIFS